MEEQQALEFIIENQMPFELVWRIISINSIPVGC
jgi:hypothetical protein